MEKTCKVCTGGYKVGTETMCFMCAANEKAKEIGMAAQRGEICITCKCADKDGEAPVQFIESTQMWVGGKYGRGTQRNVKRLSRERKHLSCNGEIGISSIDMAFKLLAHLIPTDNAQEVK